MAKKNSISARDLTDKHISELLDQAEITVTDMSSYKSSKTNGKEGS